MTILKIYFHFILIFSLVVFTHSNDNDTWIHSNTVDKLIESAMKCYDLNGVGVSIVKINNVIYQKSFGYSDIINKIPYSIKNTEILIASISKSFTTILINYYSIIKGFDMKAPINSFLPKKTKIQFMTPYRTKMTTFEDLLAHRMAINRYDFAFIFDGMPTEQLLERLKYIPALPDKFFRVKFVYNNIMYAVAEKIFEKLFNSSFIDLMNNVIFGHLNLTETKLIMKSTNITYLARSSIFNENLNDKILMIPRKVWAACGIITTLKDIGKWQIFLTSERYLQTNKLLNEALLMSMEAKISLANAVNFPTIKIHSSIRKILSLHEFHHYHYAMGWFDSKYRGYKILWHGGSFFGIESILMLIPNLNISIFLNVNAKINLVSKKYFHIVQQLPLILIDLLLTNYTLVTPNNICKLFNYNYNQEFNPNISTSHIFEIPYNFDSDVFPIIHGKYLHQAFGYINIRPFRDRDKSWISNPNINGTMVLEYGQLLKTLLIRTKPHCKYGQYFKQDLEKKDKNLKYYGFYMYKGHPYWFITQVIVPDISSNLITKTKECDVLIQRNIISNEIKLQLTLLDFEIIEFVRKSGSGNNQFTNSFMLIIFSTLLLFYHVVMN